MRKQNSVPAQCSVCEEMGGPGCPTPGCCEGCTIWQKEKEACGACDNCKRKYNPTKRDCKICRFYKEHGGNPTWEETLDFIRKEERTK